MSKRSAANLPPYDIDTLPKTRLRQVKRLLPRYPQIRRRSIPVETVETPRPYRKLIRHLGHIGRQPFNTAIVQRIDRGDPEKESIKEYLNTENAQFYVGHIAVAALTGRGNIEIEGEPEPIPLDAGTVVFLDPEVPHAISTPESVVPRYLLLLASKRSAAAH